MHERKSELLRPLVSFDDNLYNATLEKGYEFYVNDSDGKRYIDLMSGLWNVPLGYSQPLIKEAVIEQMEKLPFINSIHESSEVQMEYASKLCRYIGDDMERIFFACSGSETIELAVKTARKYQSLKHGVRKPDILIFDLSYHGTTYAAMSASGMDRCEVHEYEPIVPGFIRLKTPMTEAFHQGVTEGEYKQEILSDLHEVFEREKGKIAAVLFEPVIASGGIFEIPPWYIEELVKLCEEHDILVIADEVATGFMRTGVRFAYQRTTIKPDLICMSKAITNGIIPFGAVALGKKVSSIFKEKKQFVEHFSTQNGNLIAPAVAGKVIELLMQEDVQENIYKLESCLKEYDFRKIKSNPYVREIRQVGLMMAIDLKNINGSTLSVDQLFKVVEKIRNTGVLVYEFYIQEKTSGISIFPPYILEENLLKKSLDRIGKALLLI